MGGVHDIVIGGKIQHAIQARKHVFKHGGKLLKLALLRFLEVALVRFGKNPHFEGKS